MYYVYALCNPLKKFYSSETHLEFEPFYIGRGKNNRMYEHFEAIKKIKKLDKTNNTYKNIILKRIFDAGETPIYVKLAENLSVEKANEVEKYYIKLFGRKDLKEGILGNLTDGGDGLVNPGPDTLLKMSINSKNRVPNVSGIISYHLSMTKEELSERGKKASLSRNGGVRNPPKCKKYPNKSRSEIAYIRESNKTQQEKNEINRKISKTKKEKQLEAHNKIFKTDSVEYKIIVELFDYGLSIVNIHKILFLHKNIKIGAIKTCLKAKGKLYRRQSELQGLFLFEEYKKKMQKHKNRIAFVEYIFRAEAEKKVAEAKGEADSILLKAQSQAQANKILSESITDELVQYRALEKWDGVLPRMTGNSAVPFINVDPKN